MNRSAVAIYRETAGFGPRIRLGLLSFLTVIALLVSLAAHAGSPNEDVATSSGLPENLTKMGWSLLEVPGKQTAQFSYAGSGTIDIRADNAVAFLYRPVDENTADMGRLGWTWRVDQAVPATDLSRDSGDDRSLAVHIVFPADHDSLSFWESIENTMTELVAPPLAGKVLTYVWGGSHPEGAVMENPHFGDQGTMIVLRSSQEPTGRWIMEEIDFEADFQAAFGYAAPAPVFVAISADSDDTGSQMAGAVADLTFME